jgi:hypothetical protein
MIKTLSCFVLPGNEEAMKSIRALLLTTLLFGCLWPYLKVHAPAQGLPTPAALTTTTPADVATPIVSTGPFPVVEALRREVPRDLAIADALGIRAVRITSPASIEGIAPRGQVFKWVLSYPRCELLGLPMLDRHLVSTEKDRDIIKHVVASRGEQVQSAGKAQLQGDTLLIDPRSGHYHPTEASLERWAKAAFQAAGFAKVEICDNILSD